MPDSVRTPVSQPASPRTTGAARTGRPPAAGCRLGALCALVLAAGGGALHAQDDPHAQEDPRAVVFEAERVMLAPGTTLEGADARFAVRDGEVVAVGREITSALQQRARRVRYADATVVPGFVLPHHHLSLGQDLVETIDSFTPHLRAADAFDPFDDELEILARQGVTAVVLAPLSRNTFAGRAAVVQPGAERGSVLGDDAWLALALVRESLDQNRYPTSRMGAADLIRTAFADARDPLGPQTAAHGTLRAVLDGGLPLAIHARSHAEITTALDVCDDIGIAPILIEATEVDDSLDRLAGSGVRVVLPPLDYRSEREHLELPAQLEAARLPFAFLCRDGNQVRRSLALAVRHGTSREAAFAAVTRVPAELAGAAERIGSLRVGRRADFAVFDGDPTDLTARLLDVRVGGVDLHPDAASSSDQEASR